ncbi:hypothetical protein GCM10025772_06100 [Ferrimonas gelatinilytica]|uniref:Integrase DNA-binding domain-containing protein n=2 Tax=Ferrimonas gelatinilytica TaxID=1255257 RepID=A0ABP9RV36_9GAMM
MLLDECLQTGIRGRVAQIIKQAKAEIEGRGDQDDAFFRRVATHTPVNGCPGLVLKVGKRHRRWVYRFTPKGASSTRQITLGYFPQIGMEEAKALWQQHRGAMPQSMRFEVLVEHYLHYAKTHRRGWRREQSLLEKHIVPRWSEKAAGSITKEDVEELLGQLSTPSARRSVRTQDGRGLRLARDSLTLLRHLFDVARGKAHWQGPELPWISAEQVNPCEGVRVQRPTLFPKVVPLPELVAYQKALLTLPINERVRPLLQLQMLLLAPFSVLCRMLWDQTLLQEGRAVVPMGDGESRVLYLSPAAIQIIQQQRRHSANSPWVFPAMKKADRPMPVRYPSQMMRVIRQHLSLSDQFTAGGIVKIGHGFLRRKGSVMADIRNPIPMAQHNPLTQAQLQQNIELWQRHLADLRISG